MKKIVLFIILILFYLKAESQFIEISGSLIDSLSKSNLAYGNIIIKNQNDSIITNVLTNEKGEFKIKNLTYKKGIYLLTNYIGYTDKRIDLFVSNNSKIYLGNIYISQNATQIKEATVIGTVKSVEIKFDRKVFNINENKTASAKTVLDLLRTMPGVVVSEDGSVRFKGAPATIYVDDQPSNYLYPKIEMIPVANINKIELIDGSSRGSGSGTGGIINIKMKKITSDGLSGLLSTSENSINFKSFDKSNGFANVNVKYKKVLFFNNLNNDYQINYKNILTKGLLNYNNISYNLDNASNNNYIEKTFFDFMGAQITLSEKTIMFFAGGLYKYKQDYKTDSRQQQNYSLTDNLFDQYSLNNKGVYKTISKGLNLYFRHTFDTPDKELSGGATLLGQNENQDDFTLNKYSYLSSLPIDSLSQVSSQMNNITKSVLYNLYFNDPINANIRWNISDEGYYIFKNNSNEKFELNDQDFLPFNKISNNHSLNNQLSAHIGAIVKKCKFDGGLSLQYYGIITDYTRYKINNIDTLLKVNKCFISILPSATISYSLDSLQELKLTFARTSQAPNNNMCNFIDKQNPRNWVSGNSKLKAVNYNNLYIGYLYNKETWNVSAEAFYSLTNNEISEINYPYSEIIILTIPENIAQKSSLGIDLSSWVSLKNKVDLNLSSSIYHSYIDASELNEKINCIGLNEYNLKKKDFGYNIKFSTDMKIDKKTSGMLYFNYFSKEITFEGYNYGYINSSLSLTRKIFNKNLLITLGINNLFDDLIRHGNYYDYFALTKTTIENSSYFKRNYFFTLKYLFRQGDRGTKDFKIGG